MSLAGRRFLKKASNEPLKLNKHEQKYKNSNTSFKNKFGFLGSGAWGPGARNSDFQFFSIIRDFLSVVIFCLISGAFWPLFFQQITFCKGHSKNSGSRTGLVELFFFIIALEWGFLGPPRASWGSWRPPGAFWVPLQASLLGALEGHLEASWGLWGLLGPLGAS